MLLESCGLTGFIVINLIVYMHLQVKGSKRSFPMPSGASVPASSYRLSVSMTGPGGVSADGVKGAPSCREEDLERSIGEEGSATVEAALLTPVFFCAVCCLMAIGQLLLIEGEIHYAASQTLRVCAKDRALAEYGEEEARTENRQAKTIFDSVYDGGSLCSSWLVGGPRGIRLSLMDSPVERESLLLQVNYQMRVPLPMADHFPIKKKVVLIQRIYSGYTDHGKSAKDKDVIVYVARHGTVCHTRPDCSHICLTITNPVEIAGMINYSSLKPCARCIRKGNMPKKVYITASGDHYHSSLSCSGLKRNIRAVPYSRVRGMRKCSRCGGD